jgi:hypothetical protein
MTGTTLRPIGMIKPEFLHGLRIESDEARLFKAHCEIVHKGHASEFPLSVKGKLSAPMIPSDGGKAEVVTLDIDTTGMLLLHNYYETTQNLAVQIYDEDGESSTYQYLEYKAPEKFGRPGLVMQGPRYHESFDHRPDYIRELILAVAQSEFTKGVAELAAVAKGGSFDAELDRLRRRIRNDVDATFDNIFYVVSPAGGYFVSRTNPPRLIMEKSRWGDGDIYLKLRHGQFDASSTWVNGLLSFPAELSLSATSIRNAVVTAETRSNWMDMGQVDLDDRVFKAGIPITRDQGNLDHLREAEFAIYANAVSDMASAVVSHRGTTAFSPDSIAACSWFAQLVRLTPDDSMDDIVPMWDERVGELVSALRDDDTAFSEFVGAVEWPLLASPLTVMTAKLNKLLDRDALFGLSEPAPKHSTSATPGL